MQHALSGHAAKTMYTFRSFIAPEEFLVLFENYCSNLFTYSPIGAQNWILHNIFLPCTHAVSRDASVT